MRPQGSPAELERRRLRAIELLQRDIPVDVVAERLAVDRRSVRRWKRAHRRQGRAGLRARPVAGRLRLRRVGRDGRGGRGRFVGSVIGQRLFRCSCQMPFHCLGGE